MKQGETLLFIKSTCNSLKFLSFPSDVRPTRSRAFVNTNAPSSDEERKCEGMLTIINFVFPTWTLFISDTNLSFYYTETDNFVQPAVPKVSISVNCKRLCFLFLLFWLMIWLINLFLSCVGAWAGSRWSADLLCSSGFHFPGSHWLVVLQVWASHSSLRGRLLDTKVGLFFNLFVYSHFWRYLKHNVCNIVILHISPIT